MITSDFFAGMDNNFKIMENISSIFCYIHNDKHLGF